MKANELRIGNYYQYASDYGITYAQVQEIKHNQFGLLSDFDGTNFEICKPIPLTEEWLLKFGFKKDTWTNNDLIIGHWWNNDSILITDDFKLDGQEDMKPLQYVHQLQNLYFALTNEELTLVK
jgi:hypothetical protein